MQGPGAWRRVCGTHPGSWEACLCDNDKNDGGDSAPCLRLCGPLAGKLTNERVRRLLSLAGPNLRSLIVNDAALAFTGKSSSNYARVVIAAQGGSDGVSSTTTTGALGVTTSADNLEGAPLLRTLDLRRCPGITGKRVIQFLSLLRIDCAPQEVRLAGGCL